MDGRAGPVIGVVGGSGGVGASSFAAVLAAAARPCVLLDLDIDGGGIDVLLGLEDAPGARWSGLRLAGGALDPSILVEGLIRWHDCAVLAADVTALHPPAVVQVLGAAASSGTVVVDLPRRDCAERAAAIDRCDLVVVLARADVAGLVGAHGVAAGLGDAPRGVVVRRGEVGPREAARLVGVDLLGALPASAQGRRGLDPRRPSRRHSRVAVGVLDGVRRSLVGVT